MINSNKVNLKKIYINKLENCKVRLCCDVIWTIDNICFEKDYYYEVDLEYEQYLVDEVVDSFVITLFDTAIQLGCDIYHVDPISRKLKYNLEKYLIPIFNRVYKFGKLITINGPVRDMTYKNNKAVGVAFSGGVDSFYSVLSHIDDIDTEKRVTHLIFTLNGSAMSGISEQLDEEWFEKETLKFERVADELKLKLLTINSNIPDINNYKRIFLGGETLVTLGYVFALARLFRVFYWSSGYPIEITGLTNKNYEGGMFDAVLLGVLSDCGIRLEYSGCETTRIGKEKFIADNLVVQKYLSVCGENEPCGRCPKCLRTMSELYAIDKLDSFDSILPVKDFKRHLSSRLAEEFAVDSVIFTRPIISEIKNRNSFVIIMAFFKRWLFFGPYHLIRRALRNNKFVMWIYYDLGFEKVIYGRLHSQEFIEARKHKMGKIR